MISCYLDWVYVDWNCIQGEIEDNQRKDQTIVYVLNAVSLETVLYQGLLFTEESMFFSAVFFQKDQ